MVGITILQHWSFPLHRIAQPGDVNAHLAIGGACQKASMTSDIFFISPFRELKSGGLELRVDGWVVDWLLPAGLARWVEDCIRSTSHKIGKLPDHRQELREALP